MKKIIIANNIRTLIDSEPSFFDRSGFQIFSASSNEDALETHKAEKANLIITNLNAYGMSGEELCALIRDNEELRKVSIIIACNSRESVKAQCRANTLISLPVSYPVLMDKARELLNVAHRENYRSPIGVKVTGRYNNEPFLCYSENISVSGMLFTTERVLHEGDLIQCSFILPDSTRITSEAEITRAVKKSSDYETNQYGIKFLDAVSKTKAAISAFIKKFSKKK